MEGTAALARRYEDRPLLVLWETTRACGLACRHCRADAQPSPDPDELTTEEASHLLDDLAALGRPRPICILTGGDCLSRPDLGAIVAHAASVGVPVAVSPSVTPRLTNRAMRALRGLGVRTASVSLDGMSSSHDDLRGVPGHFVSTMRSIAMLKELGFTVQVNTTVTAHNVEELPDVAALLGRAGVDVWEVFFLVNTGRGTEVAATTPEVNEAVCHFLVDASRYITTVRTVEAPFYRRVALERAEDLEGRVELDGVAATLHETLRDRLVASLGPPRRAPRMPGASTRDGKGIVFVAANGDVYPSGFLPLRLGSVRTSPLVDLYRDHPLLRFIRAAEFRGTCGACDHADRCGGSRARAYAATGDPLGDDPGCLLVASSALGA